MSKVIGGKQSATNNLADTEQVANLQVTGLGVGNLMTAKQLEAIQQQAYDEGYAVGVAEGRAAGESEIRAKAAYINQVVSYLAQPFAQLDDQVEHQLASLAMIMVRHIVRRELKTDPGQIVATVKEALSHLPVANRKTIVNLHAEDAAIIREALAVSDDEPTWKIIEDPTISRGGCRIVTDDSHVDATVETKLNALIAAVFGGDRADDHIEKS